MSIQTEQKYNVTSSADATKSASIAQGQQAQTEQSSNDMEYAKVVYNFYEMGKFISDVQASQDNVQETIAGKIKSQQNQQKAKNEAIKNKNAELLKKQDKKGLGVGGLIGIIIAVTVVAVAIACTGGVATGVLAAITPAMAAGMSFSVLAMATTALTMAYFSDPATKKAWDSGSMSGKVQIDLDQATINQITTAIDSMNTDIGLIDSDKQLSTQDLTNSQNLQQTMAKLVDMMVNSQAKETKNYGGT